MAQKASTVAGIAHIAIAVNSIDQAANWLTLLGIAELREIQAEQQRVRAFIADTAFARFEFLVPLSTDSPISAFLARNPNGGIHHICFKSDNLIDSLAALRSENLRTITRNPDEKGAGGNRICFLNPKDFSGVLIELEESTVNSKVG